MNERNKRSFTKMQNLSIYFVIVKRFSRQTRRFNVDTRSYDIVRRRIDVETMSCLQFVHIDREIKNTFLFNVPFRYLTFSEVIKR